MPNKSIIPATSSATSPSITSQPTPPSTPPATPRTAPKCPPNPLIYAQNKQIYGNESYFEKHYRAIKKIEKIAISFDLSLDILLEANDATYRAESHRPIEYKIIEEIRKINIQTGATQKTIAKLKTSLEDSKSAAKNFSENLASADLRMLSDEKDKEFLLQLTTAKNQLSKLIAIKIYSFYNSVNYSSDENHIYIDEQASEYLFLNIREIHKKLLTIINIEYNKIIDPGKTADINSLSKEITQKINNLYTLVNREVIDVIKETYIREKEFLIYSLNAIEEEKYCDDSDKNFNEVIEIGVAHTMSDNSY